VPPTRTTPVGWKRRPRSLSSGWSAARRARASFRGVHLARRRQVVDLPPPPPVEITEQQVFRCWCSFCHAWREAPLDLSGQALGQGRSGVGIASLVAHLRLVVRAPIRVIQAWLASVHGVHLAVGEITDLLRRLAANGQAPLNAVRERIRASPVVQADETGWRENGQNGSIWFAGTPTGERYFESQHSRAGTVINALLGEDFAGVLGSDFSAAYHETPGGRHQRCWAQRLARPACPQNRPCHVAGSGRLGQGG
jgi:transposase